MPYDCIPSRLSLLFYKYGKFIARHPLPFIIVPPIIAIISILGLLRFQEEVDVEYLFSPTNAKSLRERSFFKMAFNNDDTKYFTLTRELYLSKGFLFIAIKSKHGENVINANVLNAIYDLNNQVLSQNILTDDRGKVFYSDICSKLEGKCVYSNFAHAFENITSDNILVTHPIFIDANGNAYNIDSNIGDYVKDDNDVVLSANSFLLNYYVRYMENRDNEISSEWLTKMLDILLDYDDPRIDIFFMTSDTIAEEIGRLPRTLLRPVAIMLTIVIVFAIGSCMMWDAVRSKPWVAVSGLVCAILAIGSAIGFMLAVGVPFIANVGAMPFLIIGIGLDDMFILVSAWRFTSVRLSTERRVGETFKHAAVSITITSVTDALAFGIGTLAPLRSVRIFCAYTGVAVVFCYLYIITFTAACLAYSGRREEAGLPFYLPSACCTAYRVTGDVKKSYSSKREYLDTRPRYSRKEIWNDVDVNNRNVYDNNLYVGLDSIRRNEGQYISHGYVSRDLYRSATFDSKYGYREQHQIEPKSIDHIDQQSKAASNSTSTDLDEIYVPFLTIFFGNTFVNILLKIPVRILVIIIYLVGLAIAIFGCINLKQGLDPVNLVPDGSYFQDFFTIVEDDYRPLLDATVMAGFKESLDYTQQSIRDQIKEIQDEMHKSEYFPVDTSGTVSWIDEFESYLSLDGRSISQFNNMSEFIVTLRNEFLVIPNYRVFALDIVFNADNTSIDKSRIFFQSKNAINPQLETEMLRHCRKVADESNLDVVMFASTFIGIDQYGAILSTTLINLSIAVACVFVVSLIFIPSIITSVLVTLSIVSICVFVFGYMVLWDVSLDSIGMINLLQTVGFSVDFTAHICYHFVIGKHKDQKKNAKSALGHLGTPIVQGALSTILAMVVLSTSASYILRTFFKIVTLVMVFGFFHSMFLLPVLLTTIMGGQSCRRNANTQSRLNRHGSIYGHRYADEQVEHHRKYSGGSKQGNHKSVLPWDQYMYSSHSSSQYHSQYSIEYGYPPFSHGKGVLRHNVGDYIPQGSLYTYSNNSIPGHFNTFDHKTPYLYN